MKSRKDESRRKGIVRQDNRPIKVIWKAGNNGSVEERNIRIKSKKKSNKSN